MNELYPERNESQVISTLRLFSQFICHRIPDRTFRIKGHYFPVCSRCTGLYMGVFSFFTYSYFNPIIYSDYFIIFGFLMAIPTFLDGFTQLIGLRESNNFLRFSTGFFGGIGLLILVVGLKLMLMNKMG